MLVRFGFDIEISAPASTPLVLALSLHPNEMHRALTAPLKADPSVAIRWYHDGFANERGRLIMPEGRMRFTGQGQATDSGRHDDVNFEAEQHSVQDLPDEVLQFLQPSRYCESDLLSQEAWDRFGDIATGWAKVQAICDHVHRTLTYDFMAASSFRTAHSSLQDGKGVCRDFAHLVVAFARALNIPARYVSGYLDDSEWPDHDPGDFCAWAEIFLGGRWYTFDARYNVPRIGRVVVARGRDAGDVPMITSFGTTTLESFEVWCHVSSARNTAEGPVRRT
jgi:transglutaminase-like putative cysteine protease